MPHSTLYRFGMHSAHQVLSATDGRASLRRVLYMAALVAKTHNVTIRTFYERLVEAGKPKKLAITACMRKLLGNLNAMARSGKSWTPPQLQQNGCC